MSRWPTARLEDVAVVQSGIAKGRPSDGARAEVPYLRTANVQAGYLDLGTINNIIVSEQQREKHQLRHHDVLVLEGGDADKVGRGWLWESQLPECLHQNHVFAVRTGERLLPRYLAYYLNAPQARAYFLGCAKQTVNLASINKKQLRALPIPLPSVDEQARIVTQVERLQQTLASATKNFSAARLGLAALRRSLYADALHGRLAQPPGPESAAPNLLRQLGVPAVSQRPAEWPTHWQAARLGDLASHVTSGSRDWKAYYGRGTGVFVLTQSVRMRRLDLSNPFHVDPPADDAARARTAITLDDLLVTIVGANVGNVARVPHPVIDHFVCQSLALVRPREPAMGRFLELFMSAPDGGQAHFEGCFYGQGRPHISFADLKDTVVPVPPLVEQRVIVDAFDAHMAAADALDATLTKSERETEALMRAVMRDAFSGVLSSKEVAVRNPQSPMPKTADSVPVARQS